MRVDLMKCYTEPPPPRDYVLPGLIPGTVGSIVAPGGQGKSILALMLAHTIGCGADFLGIGPLKVGRVFYLSAEDGSDILHERLHAIGSRLNKYQRDMCAQNIHVEDLTRHTPDLFNNEWLRVIESLATGTRIIFIDTLRAFHSGDENSGNEMAVLIGRIRSIAAKTGCAIVFLHHSSKALAIQGHGDLQQASRGSSVLTDNIRWQAFLAGMSKDEARSFDVDEGQRGYFVRFGISKQNYGAPFNEKWFRRREGGVLEPTVMYKSGGKPREKV